MVVGVEQVVLEGHSKERVDIVPVVLEHLLRLDKVSVPVLLQFVSKNVELLVVDVLVKSGTSLQTVDDQLYAYLCIGPANWDDLLVEVRKGFTLEIYLLLLSNL